MTITKTNLVSETVTDTVPAYSYGQMWQQQLMVWQNQQQQHCHKYNYGKHSIKCGAWGPYIRDNFPVRMVKVLGGVLDGTEWISILAVVDPRRTYFSFRLDV